MQLSKCQRVLPVVALARGVDEGLRPNDYRASVGCKFELDLLTLLALDFELLLVDLRELKDSDKSFAVLLSRVANRLS